MLVRMPGRSARITPAGIAGGLGLLVFVGVLAWLWLRGGPSDDPQDDTEAAVASSTSRPRARRPPPPRRLGLIDAPRASVHGDQTAVSGALVGTVTSWLDSSPVSGAELTFAGAGTIHSVLTGADGRFSFGAPQPGTYGLVSVLADGFQPYAPELGQGSLRYESRPGQRVEGVSIQLMPRTEVVGTVLDAEQRPVSGATIRWLGVGTGEGALADEDPEFRSDAQGEFRFAARPGSWLEAEHLEHGVGRVRVDERSLAVGRISLVLRPDGVRANGTIGGRVRSPTGAPVEGARVLASRGDDEPGAETVTDDEGRFELVDLVGGSHRVEARSPPFAPVWASSVPTGSDALQLVLAPGGAVVGVLTTESGDAVSGSTVVALRHTGPLTRVQQAQTTVFDADGEFRLEGLPPALYDIVGGAADHASVHVRGVELGTEEVELALVLPEGGRIAGRVTDAASGDAVELARVEVERSMAAGASIAPLRSSALSDEGGAFVIRGVEAGRHSIYAYALGYAPRSLSGLEVEAGGEVGAVEIALTPADDAAGEVFDIIGIGVMIKVDGDVLQVSGVIEDGGAERAGVVVQDRIIAIDAVPISAWPDFGQAVQALRGREGTEVVVTIERGEQEPFGLTVLRSRIRG